MEEAAEAERQKPARPYDDLPALPDALKEQLSSLLGTAAKLERDYQSVLDAAGTAAPTSWRLPLSRLHAQWQADLTRFRAAIQAAKRSAEVARHGPARPRAHGATDRQTRSPRPGVVMRG